MGDKCIGWDSAGGGGSSAPSGPAGGDLAGTYPNPTAVGLHDSDGTALTYGQILDGSALQRGGSVVSGVFARATWSTSAPRYFAVDFTGGLDSNLGFSDVSMAAAGAVAKKTIAGFMAIFPALGQGRTAVIAIKPVDSSGTSYGESMQLLTLGYTRIILRGTTDFSNSTSDKITCGARTFLAGPNGDGSWTTTTGGTASLWSVASGTLTAETALLGKRVRFTGNVTAALANVCVAIHSNTSSAITPSRNVSNAPANGDTFFIEEPGVVMLNLEIGSLCLAGSQSVSVAGIAVTRTGAPGDAVKVRGLYALFVMAFCEQRGSNQSTDLLRIESPSLIFLQASYLDEGETTRTVGGGRIEGSAQFKGPLQLFSSEWQYVGTTAASVRIIVTAIQLLTRFGEGGSVFSQIQASVIGAPSKASANGACIIGSQTQATVRPLRMTNNGILLSACNVNVRGVTFTSAGANPLINISGTAQSIALDDLTGTTSNTGVGVDISASYGAFITVGTLQAVTASGTAGEIKLFGGAITTYAGLTTTNVVDNAGNRLVGTAGVIVSEATQFTNVDGTALAVGELVRVSATNNVIRAQADTQAHATGPLWVALTPPANNTAGMFVSAAAAQKWVLFNAAPTLSALGYLFNTTAGLASTTVPAAGTNQKRRLGYVSKVSGSLGLVNGNCENIPTDADGAL